MDLRSRFLLAALASASALALTIALAHARPTIRSSFFAKYPAAVGSRLDSTPTKPGHCGVCHFDFNGGGARNPYGDRLAAVIGNYANNDAGRQQAMTFIQNEDNETDGFSTLAELTVGTPYTNRPTFPGLSAANVLSCLNVPLGEITGYVTPSTGADTQPPTVNLTSPNGGQSWTGNLPYSITWTAGDNVGVAGIDLWHRDAPTEAWKVVAVGLANTGSHTWFVPARPGTQASVKVRAYDAAGNSIADSSDAPFAVVRAPGGIAPSTLRDFDQPGTQPHEGGSFIQSDNCLGCHGGYDAAVEPGRNADGSMMMQSARDPLYEACLTVAEQDAPGSGDLCIRCHSPFGWMSGRSTPTDGTQLTAADRDGIACDFCHRLVDPVYEVGVSPLEDVSVLGMIAGHVPTNFSNGQYVVDPASSQRRGPFVDAVAPHPFLASPFHRQADLCGTCHDVSNPAFERVAGDDYAPNAFDAAATTFDSNVLLPLERTYSEWKHSAFPAGVYAPDFAGNRADGTVSTCQDCHMRDVNGEGCNDPAAPTRADLPLHDMMGGNAWMPGVIAALYPSETDAAALAAGAARAVSMLEKAATVAVQVASEADSFRATVTVTNRTGHKLPTGYPEGRRMWLQVVARDADGDIVYESGAYDPATGVLTHEADAVIYEIKLGISPALAAAVGAGGGGPSFHFTLNDTVYSDIRIPPQGFTNAAFATFGGAPKDPYLAGPRYADGQNWDAPTFALPPTARRVTARLHYQTMSKEYAEFLRDENVTDGRGDALYAAWLAHGRGAPVTMAADSAVFAPLDVPGGPAEARLRLAAERNPAAGAVWMRLDLPVPARVGYDVLDAQGRRVAAREVGALGPGTHRLGWDGRDASGADAGAGVYWVRARVDRQILIERVVRLR
jgi:hypothetical protein